jgi:soluble lytic murein transglycosylase-like protein
MDYFNQDMTLAVAAYNAGEMAVVRAGYRIPRFSETQKYVPKVMTLYRKLVGKSNI